MDDVEKPVCIVAEDTAVRSVGGVIECHAHEGAYDAVLEIVILIKVWSVVVWVIDIDVKHTIFVLSRCDPSVGGSCNWSMMSPVDHIGAMPGVVAACATPPEVVVVIVCDGKQDCSIAGARGSNVGNTCPVVPDIRLFKGNRPGFSFDRKRYGRAAELGIGSRGFGKSVR